MRRLTRTSSRANRDGLTLVRTAETHTITLGRRRRTSVGKRKKVNGRGGRSTAFTAVVVHGASPNVINSILFNSNITTCRDKWSPSWSCGERRYGAELRTRLRLTHRQCAGFGVWCVPPPPPRFRRNSATFAVLFRQGSGNGGDGR